MRQIIYLPVVLFFSFMFCCSMPTSNNDSGNVTVQSEGGEERETRLFVQYDKFDDTTSVLAESVLLDREILDGSKITLNLFSNQKGQTIQTPEKAYLGIDSKSKEWKFSKVTSIDIFADDQLYKIKVPKREAKAHTGYVTEYLFAPLPFDIIKEISQAERIKMKMWVLEYEFQQKNREMFIRFVKFLEKSGGKSEKVD